MARTMILRVMDSSGPIRAILMRDHFVTTGAMISIRWWRLKNEISHWCSKGTDFHTFTGFVGSKQVKIEKVQFLSLVDRPHHASSIPAVQVNQPNQSHLHSFLTSRPEVANQPQLANLTVRTKLGVSISSFSNLLIEPEVKLEQKTVLVKCQSPKQFEKTCSTKIQAGKKANPPRISKDLNHHVQ